MFLCPKHGVLAIEVEKPPIISRKVFCPWCSNRMSSAQRVKEEGSRPVFQGVPA